MMWLVFGLAAAIFISSLHRVLPRGRQLGLYRLREHARKLGFIVELQQERDREPALEGCIGYRLALEKCPVAQQFSYRRDDGGWERRFGVIADSTLLRLLEDLPETVKGIHRSGSSVVVHWLEPQNTDALDRLYTSLQPLHKMPVG